MTREFEIRSGQGLPIRGIAEVPDDPRCTVVIVHGFKGFKDWGFFPWISERLAAVGAAAIRFDCSRSGIGERPGHLDRLDLFRDDTYSQQISDLCSVVEWLRAEPDLAAVPLFLFGHSRGGGVALLAAGSIAGVRGVITWSSIARTDRWSAAEKKAWREKGELEVVNARTGQVMPISTAILDDMERRPEELDVVAAIGRLQLPILVIHGLADESVSPSEGRELAAAGRNASLVLLAGGGHTFGAKHPMEDELPRELSIAMHATVGFLGAYCRTTRLTTRERSWGL